VMVGVAAVTAYVKKLGHELRGHDRPKVLQSHWNHEDQRALAIWARGMTESKVPADFKPDPYADYAALLSPSFTPSSHANSLVLATNDPSDKQTDLTSASKRIEYDLEEVNRRIDELVLTCLRRDI